MKRLYATLLLLVSTTSFASILTHVDYTAGNTITAAGQNANENAIINDYNGSIQGSTSNSGGTAVNIQQGTISTPDLRNNAVTAAKIANNTIGDAQITGNSISFISITSSTISGTSANSGGTAAQINQGTISTPDLRNNAVSQIVHVDDAASVSSGTYSTLDSLSITTGGGTLIILCNLSQTATNDAVNGISWNVGISRRGTSSLVTGSASRISSTVTGSLTYGLSAAPIGYESLVAGTYTYDLVYKYTFGTLSSQLNHGITIIELKK
jgi:hypothetical protein